MDTTIEHDLDYVRFNFSNRDWHPFPPKRLAELGIGGNMVWHNPVLKVGALAVRRSAGYSEFPVSKAGLDYLFGAQQDGRIDTGYVVFLERGSDRTVLRAVPVNQVIASVHLTPPREGELGAYWWFTEEGIPYVRSNTNWGGF
jgi:hypothetical protein